MMLKKIEYFPPASSNVKRENLNSSTKAAATDLTKQEALASRVADGPGSENNLTFVLRPNPND